MASLSGHRVLILHNRYRTLGGEERYVEHLSRLLPEFGGAVSTLERSSHDTSSARAAVGMLRGGLDPDEVATAVRDFGATVVHAHNIHPTFGHRALAAARAAGAAVVMHLHNYRLYCAIGTVYRDGHDCTLCAPNSTSHGVRNNCRGSLAESLVYAGALAQGQTKTIDSADRFIAPTLNLAERLQAELGRQLPIEVTPNWLPTDEFSHRSEAGRGSYALLAGRVARDKGVFTAIAAAAESGVKLKIAGVGPDFDSARRYADELGAPVEFLGMLGGQALVAARLGAAMALVPSLWREVLPFGAIEALAAGLPLVVSDRGGLPELTDPELVVPSGDTEELAGAMRRLIDNADARQDAGERALHRARERFSTGVAAADLARIYDDALASRNLTISSPIA
jgi:glycosyltransferase involved in cell wall biosynthesis